MVFSESMPLGFGGRRGLSLIETLIALFIITFAVLEMAALFHSALEGSKRASQVSLASTIASKRMAEVIYWAGDGNNFSNWTSIDGAEGPDTQFPDFLVRSDSEMSTQYSPCSLTELQFPLGQQRLLSSSLRKVRVRVTWAPSGPRDKIELFSLVGAPAPILDQIKINETIPSPVGSFGTSLPLTAEGLDPLGRPIADLFFAWTLSPGTGNAELTEGRDGRSSQLRNQVYNPVTSAYEVAPGSAKLRLGCSLRGVKKSLRKDILLAP